jgi:excisionase family DNA binding protein
MAERMHCDSPRRSSHVSSGAADGSTYRPGRAVGRDRLLTAEQLAMRWQVGESQVYRLTRNGVIPVVRLGRYYRYRLDAIERWERAEVLDAERDAK